MLSRLSLQFVRRANVIRPLSALAPLRIACRSELLAKPMVVGLPSLALRACFSSGVGLDPSLKKRMDELADLFVEARDEIEMADESKGTTYFNEEVCRTLRKYLGSSVREGRGMSNLWTEASPHPLYLFQKNK